MDWDYYSIGKIGILLFYSFIVAIIWASATLILDIEYSSSCAKWKRRIYEFILIMCGYILFGLINSVKF